MPGPTMEINFRYENQALDAAENYIGRACPH